MIEVIAVDPRLSVHDVTFGGATSDDLRAAWEVLGVTRLSLIDTELGDAALIKAIAAEHYSVETVFHRFDSTERLRRVVVGAAEVGARVVYLLTGGRGSLSWEQAADRFCEAVQPCLADARAAGVRLAIENASGLYADIHIAHSLRDTVELAEMAGVGVCVDLFHCWSEAHLGELVDRAAPLIEMIQLSDYVLGDRALPARAVPGDGVIPIESFVARVLANGYAYGFDLELIGPRIDGEGRLPAARRACEQVTAMLARIDGGGDDGLR